MCNFFSKVRRLENGVTWIFFGVLHVLPMIDAYEFSGCDCFFLCIKDAHTCRRNVRRRMGKMRRIVMEAMSAKMVSDSEESG